MTFETIITVSLLVLEVALAVYCRIKLKQPANPAKPRLVPYGAIMMVTMVCILVTAAHTVSLIQGEQLKPRVKQMMK